MHAWVVMVVAAAELVVSPARVAVGEQVEVSGRGQGCAAGAAVELVLDGVRLARLTPAGSEFGTRLTVPVAVAPGSRTLAAVCEGGDAAAPLATAPVEVLDPVQPGPRTPPPAPVTARPDRWRIVRLGGGAALLLGLLGLLALGAGRLRHRRRTPGLTYISADAYDCRMQIDIEHHIGAVSRTVGMHGEHKSVTLARTYDAEVAEVWDALTNKERIPRWFLPISGDLEVGGRYQFEGNAGGTIERCDPPKRFNATWEFGGGVSWIEVRVEGDPAGGTHLELEHWAPENPHWDEYGPGAVGVGWEGGLLGLALHLADGVGMSPEEGVAWATSDEGKRFNTAAARAWGEAEIAGGTDPETARARAEKTAAFYTGG